MTWHDSDLFLQHVGEKAMWIRLAAGSDLSGQGRICMIAPDRREMCRKLLRPPLVISSDPTSSCGLRHTKCAVIQLLRPPLELGLSGGTRRKFWK